jgi:hypothetical protein
MGVLMKKHKADMDGNLAKTIAEDILRGGSAAAAAPKAAEKKQEAPAAKKEEKTEEKKENTPEAKAAVAAPPIERMVWRQGYYLNNIWQRGRYEVRMCLF